MSHSRQVYLLRLPLSQRSEEHTSELQSRLHLVCRLLLEKKKKMVRVTTTRTGIPREHLPRILARFSCVTPRRSRPEGGTDFGWAIVTHCVLMHAALLSAH